MPRRSFLNRHVRIKPPDEGTASRYFLFWNTSELYHTPEAFPQVTSPALFGNEAPLELEVGCGTGEYLCALASKHPDSNFVGFDVNLKALYIAVERARAMSLRNIRFIKAPFQVAYSRLAADSLQTVYLHFPEPILHPKYRKQRIYNDTFAGHVYRALVAGGRFSIVTDSVELFGELLGLVERRPGFERTHGERYLQSFEPEVKSRYQAYWEAHGKPIYRLEVVKRPPE
jgi:tRNA (guanine-N7-)-methyltransferase